MTCIVAVIEFIMCCSDAHYIMSPNQVDVANIVHAYQTAERIREKYPDDDWLILTGFIHDLGKVMALLGEPQVWQPVLLGEPQVWQPVLLGEPQVRQPVLLGELQVRHQRYSGRHVRDGLFVVG